MLRLAVLLLGALLLAPVAPARAALVVQEAIFGSGAGGFAAPSAIAVDGAGRVYVADRGARRVEVFDSAVADNRHLRSIATGLEAAGVAVDNRGRVYVTDVARDALDVYESAALDFRSRGVVAGPGQAPGRLEDPTGITTDPNQRLYVAEQGNMRVSVFRPSGNRIVFQTAFGIGQVDPLGPPSSIARDAAGRVYLAGEPGGVYAFDARGRPISPVGADEALGGARGVAVDRFDRVAVADPAGARVVFFGPLAQGGPVLERYGEGLRSPLAVAFAPGSLLYVLDGDRVVRMRYDDADLDAVTDAGDDCPGLANGDQTDTDGDARGDACDEDDDGDGRPDAPDACPRESSRGGDANMDGCRDATSRFVVPQHARAYASGPTRLLGRAEGGELGVQSVDVAVARRLDGRPVTAAGARCSWLDRASGRFGAAGPCSRPAWFEATGGGSWRVPLRAGLLGSGRYAVLSRARQRNGPAESRRVLGRNVRLFRVR